MSKLPGKPLTQGPDGFKGVNPRFVFDPGHENELLVLWGDSRLMPGSTEAAERASVIRANETHIIAVTLSDHSLWTYELRLKDKVGFFTRHADSLVPTLVPPRASVFSAECEMSAGR